MTRDEYLSYEAETRGIGPSTRLRRARRRGRTLNMSTASSSIDR